MPVDMCVRARPCIAQLFQATRESKSSESFTPRKAKAARKNASMIDPSKTCLLPWYFRAKGESRHWGKEQ